MRTALTCAAALLAIGALAGCGSSSKSSSSANAAAAKAPAAHLVAVRGTSSPAGASKPTRASLVVLVRVNKGRGAVPHIVGIANQGSLEAQIAALDNDINMFWSQLFAASKLQWPEVRQAFISSAPASTPCEGASTLAPTDPPVLCENVFYWTLPWIQQNVASLGDVALALDVGILWSFEAQDVLGFPEAVQKGQMTKGQYGDQTLCFTGLWVRTLSARNLFEPGDTQAVEKFLASLTGVDNVTAPDVSQQSLSQAFLAGYNSGSPASCGAGAGSGTPTGTGTTPASTTPEAGGSGAGTAGASTTP